MHNLLLHPTTAHQYKALVNSKPHAVLISGNSGSGKKTIAGELVCEILGIKDLENAAYLLNISPEKDSIGVESIRTIKDFLSRKTTGNAQIRRVILITDGHTMTSEAQNALLKSLEEPPEDAMVIVTTNDITALKPTIRSRTQQLLVLSVDQASAEKYFESAGYKLADIQAAYYMSEGRMGLLTALLEQSQDHELVAAVNSAKEILRMTTYERLLKVDELSKQKETCGLLLQGLERVILSGLRQAAVKQNQESVKRFYGLSKSVQSAQHSLSDSGNTKLVFTNLFLQM